MLIRFFTDLRTGGVPVTLPEFLSLLGALAARLANLSPEDFYYLARTSLVKDETHFDRFDRAFEEIHVRRADEARLTTVWASLTDPSRSGMRVSVR